MNKMTLIKNYLWFTFHASSSLRKTKDFKLCQKKVLNAIFGKGKK